jgi:hypothetical protein
MNKNRLHKHTQTQQCPPKWKIEGKWYCSHPVVRDSNEAPTQNNLTYDHTFRSMKAIFNGIKGGILTATQLQGSQLWSQLAQCQEAVAHAFAYSALYNSLNQVILGRPLDQTTMQRVAYVSAMITTPFFALFGWTWFYLSTTFGIRTMTIYVLSLMLMRFFSDLPTLDPFFNPVRVEEGRKRFKIGDKLRIQNAVSKCWDDLGVVREIRDSGRSYFIDCVRNIILRNNIFLKLIAPPLIALNRAGEEKKCLSSDSLLMQAKASLQAENSSMHAVRQSIRVENKNLPAKLPKSHLASDSLRENAVEKTHISRGSLPLHRPAVAGPAAREPMCTRESTRIQKQTVRFSP